MYIFMYIINNRTEGKKPDILQPKLLIMNIEGPVTPEVNECHVTSFGNNPLTLLASFVMRRQGSGF